MTPGHTEEALGLADKKLHSPERTQSPQTLSLYICKMGGE